VAVTFSWGLLSESLATLIRTLIDPSMSG